MEKRGLFQRLADFLFGFDFFISYCWADGRQYALELQRKLEESGFKCFLDSSDYAKGDNWRAAGRRALKKTSRLILVGTPKAVLSEPVANELRIFSSLRRRVFPIDFNGALAGIGTKEGIFQYLDPDLLRVIESEAALESGPSNEVLSQIRDSFNLLRQDQKRTRWFASLTAIFGIVAAVAVFFFFSARSQELIAVRNLSNNNLDLAKIAIENRQIDEALHRLWEARKHAPANDWRRDSASRLIRAWMPEAGRILPTNEKGLISTVSPGGRWAIRYLPRAENVIHKLIETMSGKSIMDLPEVHSERPIFSFSPDETLLAYRGEAGIKFLDLSFSPPKALDAAPIQMPGFPDEINSIALRSREQILIDTSRLPSLSLVELSTGKVIRNFSYQNLIRIPDDPIILISGNGKSFLCRGPGGGGLWDFETSDLENVESIDHPQNSIFSINSDASIYTWKRSSLSSATIRRENNELIENRNLYNQRSFRFHPSEPERIAIQTGSAKVVVQTLPNEDGPSMDSELEIVHNGPIDDYTFSEDGCHLIIFGASDSNSIWKIAPSILSKEPRSFPLSEDSRYFMRQDPGGVFRVFRGEDGTAVGVPIQPLRENAGIPDTYSVSPLEKKVAFIGTEQIGFALYLYDLTTGKPVTRDYLISGNKVQTAFFANDGKSLVALEINGRVSSWNTEDGARTAEKPLQSNRDIPPTWEFSVSSDGNQFLAWNGNEVQIWRVLNDIPELNQQIEIESDISEPKFTLSNNGDRFSVHSEAYYSGISIFSTNGSLITTIPSSSSRIVSSVRFSADGRLIAVDRGSDVFVFNTKDGTQVLGPLVHNGAEMVDDMIFSPDGEVIATSYTRLGGRINKDYVEVQQWDIRSGIPLGPVIRRFNIGMKLAYAKDGSKLLLLNSGSTEVEPLGDYSPLPDDEDQIEKTLELLTGSAYRDAGTRARLSSNAATFRAETLETHYGGPLVDLPELPQIKSQTQTADPVIPPEKEEPKPLTDQEKTVFDLNQFFENWISSGNSESNNPRPQTDFYQDPATINGKTKGKAELQKIQESFENSFPYRSFSLIDHEIVSVNPSTGSTVVSVRQSVILKDTNNRERELEIRDQMVLLPSGGELKIQSIDRINTDVIRDNQD